MFDRNTLDVFADEDPDSAERAALWIDIAMTDVVGLADAKFVKLLNFRVALPGDTEASHFGVHNTTKIIIQIHVNLNMFKWGMVYCYMEFYISERLQ